MDASFVSDPKSLKFNHKHKVFYLPNPVDKSFETLRIIKTNFLIMMSAMT